MEFGNGYSGAAQHGGTGTMNIGAMNTQAMVGQPPTQTVGMRLTRTNELVDGLHQLVSEAERRLEVVLSPQPPSAGTAAIQAKEANVQSLSTHIGGLNDRLEYALSRLQSLISRVEL
jgi:hypothetical protein